MRERKPEPARRAGLMTRALLSVAPGLAASRAKARTEWMTAELRGQVLAQAGGWDAGRSTRANLRGWQVLPRTPDADTLPDLAAMRGRSRDAHRNHPLARGAVQTVVTNVVGTGLHLTAMCDRDALLAAGVADADIDAAETAMEREWRRFTKGTRADAELRLTWPQIEELAMVSSMVSGDAFAAFVTAPDDTLFDVAVQLIEADHVCNPNRATNSDTLADGIEYQGGMPVAVHVAEIPRMYLGGPRNWRRLPLRAPDGTPRVLHLMRPDRIGQSRGVPFLAPVLDALAGLDKYREAELKAAVINACIAIVGKSPDGLSPLSQEATGGQPQQAGLRRAEINFDAGMVVEGFTPGEEISSFGADRPNAGFDAFTQSVLRQIGVGLELPFEVLVKHFTASYSAARAALLEAWKFYRMRRAWLAAALHEPVYAIVIENAVRRGRLVLPGFDDPLLRDAWLGASWIGPSPGQINPEVEVKAAERRVSLHISTRARETAELTGEHWETTIKTAAKEEALMRRLTLAADAMVPTAPPPEPPDDSEDPDEDDAR